MRKLKDLYLTTRFFYMIGWLIFAFVIAFLYGKLFPLAQALLATGLAVTGLDILLLFNKSVDMSAERKNAKVLSLGDENDIKITVRNLSPLHLKVGLIEELPMQFQKRDFLISFEIKPKEEKKLVYQLRPTERGEYVFHGINLFARSFLGLVERRFVHEKGLVLPVYPSIIQMKKFALLSVSKLSQFQGLKKMRRLGHSYEFEQIKNYARGDDMRSINWKATGRRGDLMVNQYEDEKSQQIYSIIDKSRVMSMPFNDLTLMDYAINSSLVISNVALQKSDKAGLITFSDKIGDVVKAIRKKTQLQTILNALYKQKHSTTEANYELLYRAVRSAIQGRSLVFLYTNFESIHALQRVLPVLRKINASHLLVVIFFENTEIKDFSDKAGQSTEEIYMQTIAEKFVHEKKLIASELLKYGIQTILTRPEDLSVNTVNKYLELKSRGMI